MSPPVAIGAVVQISDGAVQTTGVTVYHRTSSTTENSGGGTTNVGATTGTIYYTPTQAETNYESFELVAWKTGCIPACVTVVTSASATAGKVVLSGETHTSAVIPTVTTLTGHTAQTGDCYARLGAPAGASHAADVAAVKSDTAAILLDTGTDGVVVAAGSKTGYTLTATTGLGNQTANITGTVSGNSTHSAADVVTALGTGSTLTALATAAALDTVDNFLDTEIAAILQDTDELQKAWTNSGRLDLLIDAIKAKTDLMLDAAAIRTAVGLASADLDTQLADIPTVAEFEARTLVAADYGTAANQVTIAGYLDTEVAAILAAVDTEVAAIKAKTDNLPTDPADQSAVEAAITAVQSHGDTTWATATSVTVSDKTGFKLASDGLDSVATTAPAGPAANFREMVVQTWRRWFKRATRTYSGGTQQIVTYADNGTTPITTQTISDDGTTETQGVAS